MRADHEVLPHIAEAGLCAAGKDISMGGLVGGYVDPEKLDQMPKLFIVTSVALGLAALVLAVLTPFIKKLIHQN